GRAARQRRGGRHRRRDPRDERRVPPRAGRRRRRGPPRARRARAGVVGQADRRRARAVLRRPERPPRRAEPRGLRPVRRRVRRGHPARQGRLPLPPADPGPRRDVRGGARPPARGGRPEPADRPPRGPGAVPAPRSGRLRRRRVLAVRRARPSDGGRRGLRGLRPPPRRARGVRVRGHGHRRPRRGDHGGAHLARGGPDVDGGLRGGAVVARDRRHGRRRARRPAHPAADRLQRPADAAGAAAAVHDRLRQHLLLPHRGRGRPAGHVRSGPGPGVRPRVLRGVASGPAPGGRPLRALARGGPRAPRVGGAVRDDAGRQRARGGEPGGEPLPLRDRLLRPRVLPGPGRGGGRGRPRPRRAAVHGRDGAAGRALRRARPDPRGQHRL
ncbi:MAG: Sarcosine oxidase beta subunit, partial [uncultured Solirubrobacteraceae bacterium]